MADANTDADPMNGLRLQPGSLYYLWIEDGQSVDYAHEGQLFLSEQDAKEWLFDLIQENPKWDDDRDAFDFGWDSYYGAGVARIHPPR